MLILPALSIMYKITHLFHINGDKPAFTLSCSLCVQIFLPMYHPSLLNRKSSNSLSKQKLHEIGVCTLSSNERAWLTRSLHTQSSVRRSQHFWWFLGLHQLISTIWKVSRPFIFHPKEDKSQSIDKTPACCCSKRSVALPRSPGSVWRRISSLFFPREDQCSQLPALHVDVDWDESHYGVLGRASAVLP